MSESHVFRLPQRQVKWCLLFFISQLLVMNFAFAGNPNLLGSLVFRLFWLGPIVGSLLYLRRARVFELRIGDAIEFRTSTGVTSFSVHNPDLKVTWSARPNRVILKVDDRESRIDFEEYHKRDRDVIHALMSEVVDQTVQEGCEEYQAHEAERHERSYKHAQIVSRYGFPALLGVGALIGRRHSGKSAASHRCCHCECFGGTDRQLKREALAGDQSCPAVTRLLKPRSYL